MYEIKSSDIFIVISTFKGIDLVSVHQGKIKCTLGTEPFVSSICENHSIAQTPCTLKIPLACFVRSKSLPGNSGPEISEQLDTPVDPWRALLVTLL